ncbi:hypothetical protein [Taklimakanibacter deserti]|uniref:hypothetical protein n=1 Tax=Taklimakanibacter deserti TaxID=2267839 RepID=UPI000E65CAC7
MRNALTPDELDMVAKVTNEACDTLQCDAAMRPIIAARVLGFANRGERRYDALLAIALDKTTR